MKYGINENSDNTVAKHLDNNGIEVAQSSFASVLGGFKKNVVLKVDIEGCERS